MVAKPVRPPHGRDRLPDRRLSRVVQIEDMDPPKRRYRSAEQRYGLEDSLASAVAVESEDKFCERFSRFNHRRLSADRSIDETAVSPGGQCRRNRPGLR